MKGTGKYQTSVLSNGDSQPWTMPGTNWAFPVSKGSMWPLMLVIPVAPELLEWQELTSTAMRYLTLTVVAVKPI